MLAYLTCISAVMMQCFSHRQNPKIRGSVHLNQSIFQAVGSIWRIIRPDLHQYQIMVEYWYNTDWYFPMKDVLRAAVLDSDKCLYDLEKTPGPVQLTLCPSASVAELLTSVALDQPDVVLLDVTLPGVSGADLAKRLRDISPDIPILILLSTTPDWFAMESDPLVDLVKCPVDHSEIMYRIHRMWQSLAGVKEKRYRLPDLVVEVLRNDNGRLDAKKVADMFGLSTRDLAQSIGVNEPALYKTPDSRNIQTQLIPFERIAWGLLRLAGSEKGMKIWLNASNPDLDNESPIDFIKAGHVEDMAAMVEDSLLGHPS